MVGLSLGLGLGNTHRPAGKGASMEKYAFIDAGFFRQLLSFYSGETNVDIFEGINWQQLSSFGRRVFWYDALPAKKKAQSEVEYQETVSKKLEELNFIDQQDGIFVKTGVSRFRQRDNRIEQKGVDVLLAVDALQCAYKNLADEVHIYSSDLDFFPVFEALQATQTRGHLHYQPDRTSEELRRVADGSHPFTVTRALSVCRLAPEKQNAFFPRSHSQLKFGELQTIFEQENASGEKGGIYRLKSSGQVCFAQYRTREAVSGAILPSLIVAIDRCHSQGFRGVNYAMLPRLKNKFAEYG